MKPIRKDVRTFLIQDDEVLAIRYTSHDNKLEHYDLPGGGIEVGETREEAAIREFQEETGVTIYNPKYAGNVIIEYPNRIFDIDAFVTFEYDGFPQETEENISQFIKIDELVQKEKKFATVYLLDKSHRVELFNGANFKWHFIVDEDHHFIREVR